MSGVRLRYSATPLLLVVLIMAVATPIAGAGAGNVFKKTEKWKSNNYDYYDVVFDGCDQVTVNGKVRCRHPRPTSLSIKDKDGKNLVWGASVDLWRSPNYTSCNRKIYAPGAGTVKIITVQSSNGQAGWGNSLVWFNASNTEALFIAHLNFINHASPKAGTVWTVKPGTYLGLIGTTGTTSGGESCTYKDPDSGKVVESGTGPHLHVNRSVKNGDGKWQAADVDLNYTTLTASNSGTVYTSRGAIFNYTLSRNTGTIVETSWRSPQYVFTSVTSSSQGINGSYRWTTTKDTKGTGTRVIAYWRFSSLSLGSTYRVYCSIPWAAEAWGKVQYQAYSPVNPSVFVSKTLSQWNGWGWMLIGEVKASGPAGGSGQIEVALVDPGTAVNKVVVDACQAIKKA